MLRTSVVLCALLYVLYYILNPCVKHHTATLIVYVYSHHDNSTFSNLQYFVHEISSTGLYFIIIQGNEYVLPSLPNNAKYIYHDNVCYDWGTLGWFLLHSGHVALDDFALYIFINSSVRGPYIPTYVGSKKWVHMFTSMLDNNIKVVGPTISCESTGQSFGVYKQNPHVQSYALATDRIGLGIMLSAGAFTCRNDRWRTILFSELGSSAAVLNAGYNIASFVIRYRHVDWRNQSTWQCNAGISPLNADSFDGSTLQPLDCMFVKVKDTLVEARVDSAMNAIRYQDWTLNASTASIMSNKLLSMKSEKITQMRNTGPTCFDTAYYSLQNTGMGRNLDNARMKAWDHFVYFGQFEGRAFRYLSLGLRILDLINHAFFVAILFAGFVASTDSATMEYYLGIPPPTHKNELATEAYAV